MSKREKRREDLDLAGQLDAISPYIDAIQVKLSLHARVQSICTSMAAFSWTELERLWPENERLAFVKRLESGDLEALKELVIKEKEWRD